MLRCVDWRLNVDSLTTYNNRQMMVCIAEEVNPYKQFQIISNWFNLKVLIIFVLDDFDAGRLEQWSSIQFHQPQGHDV